MHKGPLTPGCAALKELKENGGRGQRAAWWEGRRAKRVEERRGGKRGLREPEGQKNNELEGEISPPKTALPAFLPLPKSTFSRGVFTDRVLDPNK